MGQKDPSYVPPFAAAGGSINSMARFQEMERRANAAGKPAVKKAEPAKKAAPKAESAPSIDALIRSMREVTARARKITGTKD